MKRTLLMALVATSLGLSPLFAKATQVEGVVNLNTATVEQLMLLPGIGRSKSEAIFAYRQQHPFKAPQELIEVKGIGPKMFQKLEKYLAVQGPTTIREASSASPTASRASQ